MKRIVTLSLVLAMCLALLSGCGGSQSEQTQEPAESQGTEETGSTGGSEAEFVWVASCANTEDHPAVQGVMKFAELLEEKSGGRIHMDVFTARSWPVTVTASRACRSTPFSPASW